MSQNTRRESVAAWLSLTLTPTIGPQAIRALLERFGSAQAVWEGPSNDIIAVLGPRRAQALLSGQRTRSPAIARTLEWLEHDPQHHLVTLADADYPAPLRAIDDAPAVLYLHGQRSILQQPMMAVVGARNATAAGAAHARSFAHALSGQGWAITSGLALGIDGAAHEGALTGGAGTLAVLGTGIDVIYPAVHAALAHRITQEGALLSELPLGTRPAPGQFPRRNRLIAGLSHGVLVVEAAVRSGSLITARLAADFGREVFAIPGSIDAPLARGCHALLRDGAKLVESAADILSELPPLGACPPYHRPTRAADGATQPKRSRRTVSTAAQSADLFDQDPARAVPPDPLLACLGHDPVYPDTLAQHLGITSGTLGAQLVMLELAGLLERLPDGRIRRAHFNA